MAETMQSLPCGRTVVQGDGLVLPVELGGRQSIGKGQHHKGPGFGPVVRFEGLTALPRHDAIYRLVGIGVSQAQQTPASGGRNFCGIRPGLNSNSGMDL